MAAVDLGLLTVAQALDIEFIPWRVRALVERARSADPGIDLRMDVGLGASRMIDSDWPSGIEGPILYWGDFHHMAQYVSAVAAIIGDPGGNHRARRYLLLDGVDLDMVARSATFGTTLIFNSAADFMDNAYGAAIRRYLNNNHESWFRDPISTTFAARIRHGPGVSTAVDPALFIRRGQLDNWVSSSDTVGVFLGRTSRARQGLMQIAEILSLRMGWQLEWIDWGDTRGFPRMILPEGISTNEEPGSSTAMAVISRLASCSAVVTDSYHMALISWRLGIPAVTVAAPASSRARSVTSGARWSWRDKRDLAGSSYGALDLVVRIEELEDAAWREARIQHILETVEEAFVTRFVQSQIEADITSSLTRLRDSLTRVDVSTT